MSTIYAAVLNGDAVEVSNGRAFWANDAEGEKVLHLPGALEAYLSEGTLAAKGIVPLEVPEPPAGQVVKAMTLILLEGVPALDVMFGLPTVDPEVAMHRAHKAMMLTPWAGDRPFGAADRDLYDAALLAMQELPAPSNKLARAEFLRAPNIVRAGVTTAAIMALLGMTDEECDELFRFASTLP